ncbi:MAG: hypothetical protein US50_C0005G0021 [Candidatus Nomurabacteria bacterium GW2011_GWB1_37_5]|uniref:Uncharacterized protein n=1 Tax=Candidatus Nomurabacteria bacterium GW2011_GWB1_37_5 TaxID=1618742 RepID=A0A0G0HB83_9BACT|nr:MAG: hypothetical protein US50_C0005G0021 [Candidatus Nomurabacteria bacterium GW2011_GWB1_37_5]
MENNIIDLCKKKVVTVFVDGDRGGDLIIKGMTAVLIPKEIEELAQKNRNIICNEITKEMATAVMKRDSLMISAMIHLGGGIHPSLSNFLRKIEKGDILMIHHYRDKSYFTSVVELNYVWEHKIVHESPVGYKKLCDSHGGIEGNNIIAIAKIPANKKVAKRSVFDNDHSIFLNVAKRIS